MRFITRLRLPDTGEYARLAAFQRELIRATYANQLTVASLPTGNGKTSLFALLALERICRGESYTQVDVLATKYDQALEIVKLATAIAETDSELGLHDRLDYRVEAGELIYRPTGARMTAHSARLKSIEGRRFRLALIDEIGFVLDELLQSILARIGKGAGGRILGMGTPGFEPNVLHRIRELNRSEGMPAGAAYLEWSAPEGAEITDRRAWRRANPAAAAGFLDAGTQELQARLQPERTFRVYHFGQWVEAATGWLPPGAWARCPFAPEPRPESEVVLALEGSWHGRTAALVGATLDGELFSLYAEEHVSDRELADAVRAACDRFDVLELAWPRRVRGQLFTTLLDDGLPVTQFSPAADVDAASADEFYRSIIEGDVTHDHDERFADQVAALRVRRTVDGSLRLTRPEDEPADAGLAARAAWWRARELARTFSSETPRIY